MPTPLATFTELEDAILYGKAKIVTMSAKVTEACCCPLCIYDLDRSLVIGLISNDANGVTVHKLATWPPEVGF